MKYILFSCLLFLLMGCSNSSYQDCFNDCFDLHSDKEHGIMTTYKDTSCLIGDYFCISIEKNTEHMEYYVTKECYKECKPSPINKQGNKESEKK